MAKRKSVPCRPCLECCFHTCRVAMGGMCSDTTTAVFRWFVVRPLVFLIKNVPWGLLFDWFMYLLGPALICLATSIVCWYAPAPPPLAVGYGSHRLLLPVGWSTRACTTSCH